jgi:nucleotide-binding universal stress UspA family protein
MNKILVPTDFSDGAYNALKHAYEYAEILGTEILVVHAFSLPPSGSSTVMVNITDRMESNAKEELTHLKKRFEKEKGEVKTEINFRAEHGTVVNVVNRLCKIEDIDFVVMGTRGASGVAEKWLGSNTAAAARNIRQPLIAIPGDLKFTKLESLLFSTDLKVREKTGPFEFVRSLADKTGARVEFLHVLREASLDGDEKEKFKVHLAHFFSKGNAQLSIYRNSGIDKGLEEAIADKNPDMLVVIKNKYNFLESFFHSSVSKQIINSAALPVLVLKC